MRNLLLALTLQCLMAMASILRPDRIFDIDDSHLSYSCKPFYSPRDSKTLLHQWWFHANELNDAGRAALAPRSYTRIGNGDTRKLAQAAFGIRTPDDGLEPSSAEPDEQHDYARLAQASRWFENMNDFLHTGDVHGKKPRLFCGASFIKLQFANDPALDPSSGRPRHPPQTIEQYERSMGRRFDDYWYFFLDVPSKDPPDGHERSYYREEKTSRSEQWGYGRDARGHKNFCGHLSHRRAMGIYPSGTRQPHDFGLRRSFYIVLCTEKWARSGTPLYKGNTLPRRQPVLGMNIHDLDTNAHVLYHELWHYVERDKSPDVPELASTSRSGWPHDRRSFGDTGRWITDYDGVMSVALYDQATIGNFEDFDRPQLKDIPQMWSVHSPENYYWFALAAYLQKTTGMQWSSGTAERRNTAWKDMRPLIMDDH